MTISENGGSGAATRFPSSETIVDALLPPLYRFVQQEHLGFFKNCPSYFTSFDSWSKFGDKFVSQNYHMIDPRTFTYRILLLDVIPFRGQQFAELVAKGLLRHRTQTQVIGMISISVTAFWGMFQNLAHSIPF